MKELLYSMKNLSCKRYLVALFSTFILLLGTMATSIYFVDPAKLFHTNYEQGIVNIIIQGKNVDNLRNFDEISFQVAYLRKSKEKFDALAFGSSRAMYVRKKHFPGLHFHNLSVSAAHISDIMSLYEEYSTSKGKPKLVLLGIDQWMFIPKEYNPVLRNQYIAMLKRLKLFDPKIDGVSAGSFTKLQYLFDGYCFNQSIQMILKSLHGGKAIGQYKATDNPLPKGDGNMMFSDGSYYFAKKMTNASQKDVNNYAKNYTDKKVQLLSGNIDPIAKHRFEVFLDSITRDGVHVIIFLSPFHPITKSRMIKMKEYSGVDKLENYLQSLSVNKNISVMGSYDPKKCGCKENEFFDGHHIKQSCVDKILNTIHSHNY
jgi:hypothetical protein